MTAPGLSDESRLREEVCRVGRSLFERGYELVRTGSPWQKYPPGFDKPIGTGDLAPAVNSPPPVRAP